jgi:uncharacterized membrane protein
VTKRTAILTAAAAALYLAGAGFAASGASAQEAEKIKCEGVNSCKGHSECKGAQNECKGKNECQGKGFLMLTQEECDAAKAAAEPKEGE